nr:MAG TPA: hypothetical protein [Caudoviricetes sp.]
MCMCNIRFCVIMCTNTFYFKRRLIKWIDMDV